jgi:hypothetical protein
VEVVRDVADFKNDEMDLRLLSSPRCWPLSPAAETPSPSDLPRQHRLEASSRTRIKKGGKEVEPEVGFTSNGHNINERARQ